MPSKQAPVEFIEKIKAKMASENIGVSQLARKIGVSHPTIVEIVTHGNKPSLETAVALAKWFHQKDITIIREAGLLPPGDSDEVKFDDWQYLLAQMTPEDEAELRQIAELKIDRREKSESLKSLKSKKT